MTASTTSGRMRKPTYHRNVGTASRTAGPRRLARSVSAVRLRVVTGSGGGLDAGPRFGSFGAVVRGVHGVLESRQLVRRRVDDLVGPDVLGHQLRGLVVGMREEAELRLRRGLLRLQDVVEEG